MSEQHQEIESQKLGDFDPRIVHERDPKTNRITRINAHRVICHEGIRYYEWPKNSRNLWYENKLPAGRLDKSGSPDRDAKHEAYIPPRTEQDDFADKLVAKDHENKKLSAEMELVKRELAAFKFEAAQKQQQTVNKIKEQEHKDKHRNSETKS